MDPRDLTRILLLMPFLAALGMGCASAVHLHSVKTNEFSGLKSTSVYIVQPGDLIHGGSLVEGTGAEFLSYLKIHLNSISRGSLKIISSGNMTSQTHDIDKADALHKGKEHNTNYVLVINLGEMRDAAPWTFRSDYVSINDGVLYRVSDNKEVWRAFPLKIDGANLYRYNRLLDDLARKIALDIVSQSN
ncbi:MAG: hypothetical protein ACM3OG_10555 [Actinomycetota bacterium]